MSGRLQNIYPVLVAAGALSSLVAFSFLSPTQLINQGGSIWHPSSMSQAKFGGTGELHTPVAFKDLSRKAWRDGPSSKSWERRRAPGSAPSFSVKAKKDIGFNAPSKLLTESAAG